MPRNPWSRKSAEAVRDNIFAARMTACGRRGISQLHLRPTLREGGRQHPRSPPAIGGHMHKQALGSPLNFPDRILKGAMAALRSLPDSETTQKLI